MSSFGSSGSMSAVPQRKHTLPSIQTDSGAVDSFNAALDAVATEESRRHQRS